MGIHNERARTIKDKTDNKVIPWMWPQYLFDIVCGVCEHSWTSASGEFWSWSGKGPGKYIIFWSLILCSVGTRANNHFFLHL